MGLRVAFWPCVLLQSACSTIQKTPVAPSLPAPTAVAAYARVLASHVNDDGEVDFKAIADKPADLLAYVRYVSDTDFSSVGSSPQILAHHLNAYNALSIYTVIAKGIPETNAGFRKVRFFYLTKMKIGGKVMSLVDYENKYIRTLGEDRVHWALNCMAVSCPRLPKIPFDGDKIESQLQQATTEFFNSEKHVRLDEAKKTVYVSEILKFFPEDFVPTKATSILAYVNLHRRVAVPLDYKLKYISYDWTINSVDRNR